MPFRSLLAGLLIALTASPVLAQRGGTIPLGKPLQEFRLRADSNDREGRRYDWREEYPGRVLVIFSWRVANNLSLNVYAKVRGMIEKYRAKGVFFISMTPDKKESADQILKERNLDPFEHYFTESGASDVLEELGIMAVPGAVIVDPLGNLAWRGMVDDSFEARLDEIIARTNPPAGDAKTRDRMFRDAEKLHDQKEYAKAYSLGKLVRDIAFEGTPDREKATQLMEKCEASAAEWLKQAAEDEKAEKFDKASYIVAQVAVRMRDTEVGRSAETEIGRMNANRKIKELIRAERMNAQGELKIERAERYEDAERFDLALDEYEAVKKEFEEAEIAKEADKRIKRIAEDPAVRKKVDEIRAKQQADNWLDLAERYAQIELYDQAREQYEKVLKEHPTSDAAKKAKEQLQKLPKSKPQ